MDIKDVDFKTYMRQKLDEEAAAIAAAPQVQPSEAPMSGAASIIAQYVKNGDLKEGFKNLAQDLVQAIVDYAKNQVVSEDQFDSIDAKAKYENFEVLQAKRVLTTNLSPMTNLLLKAKAAKKIPTTSKISRVKVKKTMVLLRNLKPV